MRFQDLKGKQFNALTVLERTENLGGRVAWLCVCECGNTVKVKSFHLKNGEVKSCGCYNHKKKHGLTKTRLYCIWSAMKQRCYNENHSSNFRYKNKGVCDEWKNKEDGFLNFHKWSVENGYSDKLSIDRIDNSKGYSPNNCRWVNKEVQTLNRVKTGKNNKTGFVGVYKTDYGKWYSMITTKGKTIYLGSFSTLEEAVKVRKEAEYKYHTKVLESELNK